MNQSDREIEKQNKKLELKRCVVIFPERNLLENKLKKF